MTEEDARLGWGTLFRGEAAIYIVLVNLGILLYGTDIYLIFTLMPAVIAELGGVAYYTWAVMFFIVSAIVGSAAYAPLRARLGGRAAYATGGVIYLTATLGCAMAPNLPVFLAARLVDGFGGGLVMAGSMAYTSALFAPRLRTRAIAVASFTWIAGSISGPVIGGIFSEIGWWRGAFYALIPLILLFIAMVLRRIPSGLDSAARDAGRKRFPIERVLLLGVGVACVAASGRVGSDMLRVVLIAAAALLVWLTLRFDANAHNRLFPTRPFSVSETVGLGYWTQVIVGALYTTVAIYLPLVLAAAHGVPPLYIGLMNALTSVCWSLSASGLSGLQGRAELTAIRVGPILIFAGLLLLALTAGGGSLIPVVIGAAVLGIGVGTNYVHTLAITMGAARPGEESVTASSLQTMRNLGIAFGSAGAGVVATIAGLGADIPPEQVVSSVTWVYVVALLPSAAMIVIAFRFAALRRAAALASTV